MLISIGGDGTILRAATLVSSEFYLNAGRLGFLTVQKRNIDEFLQIVIEEKYAYQRTLLSLSCPLKRVLQDINFAMNEIR
jgi:NAD+ kinase